MSRKSSAPSPFFLTPEESSVSWLLFAPQAARKDLFQHPSLCLVVLSISHPQWSLCQSSLSFSLLLTSRFTEKFHSFKKKVLLLTTFVVTRSFGQ